MLARRSCTAILAFCLALAGSRLRAATASLVADLNQGSQFSALSVTVLAPWGDRILFDTVDASHGTHQLWVSDGTDAGTRPLHETYSYPPRIVGTSGSLAYYTVERSDGGILAIDLWRTDGTAAGTLPLEAKVENNSGYAILGDHLFFTHCPVLLNCELWRSDGTAPGTARVFANLPALRIDSYPSLVPVGNHLYLALRMASGDQLWRSDGTPAGTGRLSAFSYFNDFLGTLGNRFLFSAQGPDAQFHVWVDDGSVAGPRPIADFGFENRIVAFRSLGPAVYFLVHPTGGSTRLWATDGTAQGTVQVADFGSAGPTPEEIEAMEKIGNRLLFAVYHGGTVTLWSSGGTAATPTPLTGCPGGCPTLTGRRELTRLGGQVFFAGTDPAHGEELWSSDGTALGTRRVSDLCPGTCAGAPVGFTLLEDKVYFAARTSDDLGAPAPAFFRSDGTAAGTERLAALASVPALFTPSVAGGKIFFDASGLWSSDGTAAGTALVTVLGEDGVSSNPQNLRVLGNTLVWSAAGGLWSSPGSGAVKLAFDASSPSIVGNLGFFFTGGGSTLWRTDGSAAGTAPLFQVPGRPDGAVGFSGKFLFIVTTFDPSGRSLWESDGTAAGTVARFPLPAGVPDGLYRDGSDLYFAGGRAIWKSDGTAAGTRLLFKGDPDSLISLASPPQFTRAGADLFFVASIDSDGPVLWKTDGTTSGTGPVLPGVAGPLAHWVTNLAAWNGTLYFLAGSQASDSGRGLWRTDGTPAGTVLLKTFGRQQTPDNEHAFFTPYAGQLFFAVDDGEHGTELWRTDGTAAGTVLVRDIQPGPGASAPASLLAAGGLLYFTADDGDHGIELWQSDGTAAGTRMVQDLAPGPASSSPRELTAVGDQLFFHADDGIYGRELWVYPLDSGVPSCPSSETSLCLHGGRFRVEVAWEDFAGQSGMGHAGRLTDDTGTFWFFSPANIEVVLKVLDGRALDDHFWFFYGALSNVHYTVTVTDTQTGATRRYVNPPGHFGSVGDTQAFGPLGATGSAPATATVLSQVPIPPTTRSAAIGTCVVGPSRLCLNGGRFAVEASWRDFQGRTGTGMAVSLTSDTGTFWFFDPANVEVVLKVVDGRGLNGKFWVFYGALSNVEYTLTVTDTETGAVHTYRNPSGRFASVGDTGAF